MNRPQKLALALGLSFSLVFGSAGVIGWRAWSERQRIFAYNISEVLVADAKLKRECVVHLYGLKDTPPDIKKMALALRKVDASDCPKNFQLAWLAYVQQLAVLAQSNTSQARIKTPFLS